MKRVLSSIILLAACAKLCSCDGSDSPTAGAIELSNRAQLKSESHLTLRTANATSVIRIISNRECSIVTYFNGSTVPQYAELGTYQYRQIDEGSSEFILSDRNGETVYSFKWESDGDGKVTYLDRASGNVEGEFKFHAQGTFQLEDTARSSLAIGSIIDIGDGAFAVSIIDGRRLRILPNRNSPGGDADYTYRKVNHKVSILTIHGEGSDLRWVLNWEDSQSGGAYDGGFVAAEFSYRQVIDINLQQ